MGGGHLALLLGALIGAVERLRVGGGKWAVASDKWAVTSGRWQVTSGRWQVLSGQGQVTSGRVDELAEVSGQWGHYMQSRAS